MLFRSFSPVLNKADWNTEHLEAACRRAGVKTLKFPWLQWGGYWPQAATRKWGAHGEWGLPRLTELGRQREPFERFYDRLFDPATFVDGLSDWVDFTTSRLQANERRGEVDLPVSDWIHQHYRDEQLFLTPDHPSNALYKHLMARIADALGLVLEPGFFSSRLEFQEGVRLPVLPAIQRALGLAFSSAEWGHHEFLGELSYGLREFALSYHVASQVVLGQTRHNTVLKTPEAMGAGPGAKGRTPVRLGARRLMRLVEAPPQSGHRAVALLDNVDANEPSRSPLYLLSQHWQLLEPAR